MNHNYPDYILKKLRAMDAYETSDKELEELDPEEAFRMVLEYEGIFGYTTSILCWIQDIFKVKLNPYGDNQTKEEFAQGLSNIITAHHYYGDKPLAMRVDEDDNVYVLFDDASVVSTKEI